MFDHYTKNELIFKLNCHIDTLDNLAKIGPGFRIVKVTRGTKHGFVIPKKEFYAWMDAVQNDLTLYEQVRKRAPSITFIGVGTDRSKWLRNKAHLNRARSVCESRPYGRSIADEKADELKRTGCDAASEGGV